MCQKPNKEILRERAEKIWTDTIGLPSASATPEDIEVIEHHLKEFWGEYSNIESKSKKD